MFGVDENPFQVSIRMTVKFQPNWNAWKWPVQENIVDRMNTIGQCCRILKRRDLILSTIHRKTENK